MISAMSGRREASEVRRECPPPPAVRVEVGGGAEVEVDPRGTAVGVVFRCRNPSSPPLLVVLRVVLLLLILTLLLRLLLPPTSTPIAAAAADATDVGSILLEAVVLLE